MSKKIAIVTCGGDSPGLNAVIRAVVKTAIGRYGYEVYGIEDGYSGLVLGKFKKMESKDVSGILDRGGTILGTSRDNPFDDFENGGERAMKNFRDRGLDCLVAIGGDGTLKGALRFKKEVGMNVIGVPKTIDNDLDATDMTFGFMTAVDIATEAIDRLHSTAESHHRVMLLEVMGRNAGWIALESGIAGGADVILIPEIPYDIRKVADKIIERKNNGKNFSIVVVAEGAVAKGAAPPKSKNLGGISHIIADQLDDLIKLDCRVTVLGYIQRGGTPSSYDRILSTRYGVAAAEYINDGKYGVMVALQGNKIIPVPLEQAVGRQKLVQVDGELVRIAKSVGVGFGD